MGSQRVQEVHDSANSFERRRVAPVVPGLVAQYINASRMCQELFETDSALRADGLGSMYKKSVRLAPVVIRWL